MTPYAMLQPINNSNFPYFVASIPEKFKITVYYALVSASDNR